MPLSGGTAGAHDDAMHQGSAKKDVSGGVAGINASGHLLAVAHRIYLRLGVANQVSIWDRTNVERIVRWVRNGAGDYEGRIMVSGVEQKIQVSTDKDVVNGIAALDASGFIQAAGAGIAFPRNGSDDVHIYERTSGEEAYAFHRTAANDYTFYIKESNVWRRFQTETMKDVANGIAGLDANILLNPAVHAVGLEEYSNHLGATDNFTTTGTAGNGVAATDAANHKMDLSSGITIIGDAHFETKKALPMSSKPIIANFVVQNIVIGAGGGRVSYVGLGENWAALSTNHYAVFKSDSVGDWFASSYDGFGYEGGAVSTVVNGDVLTIVTSSAKTEFYINGTLEITHIVRIPSNAVKVGAIAESVTTPATTSREISVDMMSFKRYA